VLCVLELSKLLADAAQDSRANLRLLEDKRIGAGIRIKAGATFKSYGSSARPRAVRDDDGVVEEIMLVIIIV